MVFKDFLSVFYLKELETFVKPTAFSVGFPKKVTTSLVRNSDTCYTLYEDWNGGTYRIVFSKLPFYEYLRPESFNVTKENVRDFYPTLYKLFRGYFWHEMGHVLYSDFEAKYIVDYT